MTLSASPRERGLDTLRALAILLVMLYHTLDYLPESFEAIGQFGWMGVDLFFVLSGYLIGHQLLRPYAMGTAPARTTLTSFYRRRAFRILPAYLVVVGLYAAVPAWREAPGFGPLWKFLTFTENLDFNPEFRAFSHVWSLCVEEHFYLVLPLLVIGMMRRPAAWKTIVLLASLALGGILLRGYAITHTEHFMRVIYYPTWMRLDGLLAGVALAIVRVFRAEWWAKALRHGHTTFAAGLALVAFVFWLFRDNSLGEQQGPAAWGMVVGLPMLATGFALLVASSVSSNGLLSRIPVPGSRWLAVLAFTLYLSHKAIVHLDRLLLPTLTTNRDLQATAIYLVTCMAAAALLHFCIERPFMVLRDHIDKRPAPAVEAQMLSDPAL